MKTKRYNMILLIAVLLMAQSLFAGKNLVIVKNDGTVEWKPLSDIDRVIFGDTDTVTDIDGNTYITVQIGNLWWMAENLKTTHYRDGTGIPNVTVTSTWAALTKGAYCYYDNDSGNAATYGALYNWYAVIGDGTKELAPTGWRVPSDDDWKALEMHLGMSQTDADNTGYRGTDECTRLKSSTGWVSDGNGTDEVGFAALPGGYRSESNGNFYQMFFGAHFWSASEANSTYARNRILYGNSVTVFRSNYNKRSGFSVRCVKDAAP